MTITIVSPARFSINGHGHLSHPWRPKVIASLKADFAAYQAGTPAREIARRRGLNTWTLQHIFSQMGAGRRRGGLQPSHKHQARLKR